MAKTLTDSNEKACNSEYVKVRKTVVIGYEQESLECRRSRVRGFLPQIETMTLIGVPQELNSMPTKKRLYFKEMSKTNKGTLLGPVIVPPVSDVWSMSFDEKRELFGPCRMAVGGPTDNGGQPEEDDDAGGEDEIPPGMDELRGETKKRRKNRSVGVEPVFYQSLKSCTLWRELLHSYNVKNVVSFTAGDTSLLEACIIDNIPAVAFAMTKKHQELAQDTIPLGLISLRCWSCIC